MSRFSDLIFSMCPGMVNIEMAKLISLISPKADKKSGLRWENGN